MEARHFGQYSDSDVPTWGGGLTGIQAEKFQGNLSEELDVSFLAINSFGWLLEELQKKLEEDTIVPLMRKGSECGYLIVTSNEDTHRNYTAHGKGHTLKLYQALDTEGEYKEDLEVLGEPENWEEEKALINHPLQQDPFQVKLVPAGLREQLQQTQMSEQEMESERRYSKRDSRIILKRLPNKMQVACIFVDSSLWLTLFLAVELSYHKVESWIHSPVNTHKSSLILRGQSYLNVLFPAKLLSDLGKKGLVESRSWTVSEVEQRLVSLGTAVEGSLSVSVADIERRVLLLEIPLVSPTVELPAAKMVYESDFYTTRRPYSSAPRPTITSYSVTSLARTTLSTPSRDEADRLDRVATDVGTDYFVMKWYITGKTILSTPDRDSNPDLSIIGSLVYCKNDALDHAVNEADDKSYVKHDGTLLVVLMNNDLVSITLCINNVSATIVLLITMSDTLSSSSDEDIVISAVLLEPEKKKWIHDINKKSVWRDSTLFEDLIHDDKKLTDLLLRNIMRQNHRRLKVEWGGRRWLLRNTMSRLRRHIKLMMGSKRIHCIAEGVTEGQFDEVEVSWVALIVVSERLHLLNMVQLFTKYSPEQAPLVEHGTTVHQVFPRPGSTC
uniref:Uncharacterized protein n=1 Tax=Timema bartmani TaxID=61472 RepID=A0A7R9F427_9NEOP|nr:unnamed protein product [Timema bartmani]